jgi:hypothetical protein
VIITLINAHHHPPEATTAEVEPFESGRVNDADRECTPSL